MNQEKLQLTGGNTIRRDRNATDFYPTPPEATIALIRFLESVEPIFKPNSFGTIWEPAYGDGAMAKVFDKFGYPVFGTDLNMGPDYDFLKMKCPEIFSAIITNPPFSLADEFIRHAVSICDTVSILHKGQFWHAKKRLDIYKKTPPSYVLPLTWRVDFLNGAKGGRPTMEVAWSVWLPGHKPCQYIPLKKP
jgi:hypothetical protein